MAVDFLPEHLVILGGNYIGLEFGQMYRRFGSRVTIVQRNPYLIHEDDDVPPPMFVVAEIGAPSAPPRSGGGPKLLQGRQ
jgi:Pyridine nucleotide-disulphide oxidoreductase